VILRITRSRYNRSATLTSDTRLSTISIRVHIYDTFEQGHEFAEGVVFHIVKEAFYEYSIFGLVLEVFSDIVNDYDLSQVSSQIFQVLSHIDHHIDTFITRKLESFVYACCL